MVPQSRFIEATPASPKSPCPDYEQDFIQNSSLGTIVWGQTLHGRANAMINLLKESFLDLAIVMEVLLEDVEKLKAQHIHYYFSRTKSIATY